jgi:dTDP-4-dehydrorhamnose reductase
MLALLVTGAHGMLGQAVLARAHRAADVAFARGLGRAALDVTDPFGARDTVQEWARVVRSDSPDHRLVVVNCAAYTAVDRAETDEASAYAVNAAGPALLASACAAAGAGLLQVSTDYVFPGDATSPYEVDDPTGPRTAYGRTKLAGEEAVRSLLPDASWVVRTAWLYGAGGPSFVRTMAALERSRETVDVVADQVGSPTWTGDLADGLLALCRSSAPAGTYHATNGGEASWWELARAVFEELGADPARVHATDSASFVRPAPRPSYSVLSGRAWASAGLPPLRPWREALAEAFRVEGDALRAP